MNPLAFPPLTQRERRTVERKARYRGLHALSSDHERGSLHNYGGFQLRDSAGRIVAGGRFNLSTEDALEALTDTGIRAHP